MLQNLQSNLDDHGPMWVPTFVGDSALIIGNGESRSWYQPCHQTIVKDGVDTWGCNAIYRDGKIDNLVATDPAMQQEIYKSDYATHNTCWFLEWNKVPTEIGLKYQKNWYISIKKKAPRSAL